MVSFEGRPAGGRGTVSGPLVRWSAGPGRWSGPLGTGSTDAPPGRRAAGPLGAVLGAAGGRAGGRRGPLGPLRAYTGRYGPIRAAGTRSGPFREP